MQTQHDAAGKHKAPLIIYTDKLNKHLIWSRVTFCIKQALDVDLFLLFAACFCLTTGEVY